jgi:uncharacterized protein YukE
MSASSSGSTSSSPSMVPNPMHEALSQLYAKLQGDAATMSNALKPANQQMAAGSAWVGQAAQSWGSQLDGHSGDCATQVNAMLADVSQALAAEPAQVTLTEAEEKSKIMMMMERGY